MEWRELGHSGIKVAPLALGCNVFGWIVQEEMAFRILDAFVDFGLNLIDTADSYSDCAPGIRGGESETIIGKWLKQSGKRDRIVLATKVGMEIGTQRKDLSKDYIEHAVDESLKRLQTDHIDLCQAHGYDPAVPLQETLQAFELLMRKGKIRAIGVSRMSPEHLDEALIVSDDFNLPRYESLQTLYNLYDRKSYETELEALCRKHELGVLPYHALAGGFLSGRYRSESNLAQSHHRDDVKKYLNERGFRILEALGHVAEQRHCTQAQLALAWLINRPGITAPITSVTDSSQLEELAASTQLKLSDREYELLWKASEEPDEKFDKKMPASAHP